MAIRLTFFYSLNSLLNLFSLSIKLIDSNRLNLHSTVIPHKIPCRLPLTLVIPESIHCMRIGISPWFATLTIREIGICTTNSHI